MDYSNKDYTENQLNEEELYDLILEYLIDEGYTNTLGGAEIIIENMSDEWLEDIVEKYVEWDKSRGSKPSPRERAATRQGQFSQTGAGPGNRVRGQQIGAVRSNMRLAIQNTPPSRMGLGSGPMASPRFKAAAIRVRGGSPGSSPIRTVPGLRDYNRGAQSAIDAIKNMNKFSNRQQGERFGVSQIGLS